MAWQKRLDALIWRVASVNVPLMFHNADRRDDPAVVAAFKANGALTKSLAKLLRFTRKLPPRYLGYTPIKPSWPVV